MCESKHKSIHEQGRESLYHMITTRWRWLTSRLHAKNNSPQELVMKCCVMSWQESKVHRFLCWTKYPIWELFIFGLSSWSSLVSEHEAAIYVQVIKRRQETQPKSEPSPRKKKSCIRLFLLILKQSSRLWAAYEKSCSNAR